MTETSLGSDLKLTVDEQGNGRPALVLHGGGGPATVAMISAHLAQTMQVLTPTHPGWNGTLRPEWLTGVDDLAMLYLGLIRERGWRDVTVVGSSIGGWIAAEMAVRDLGGLIGRLVLIDAMGVKVPGEDFVDFFSLTPRSIAEHSYHEPDKFFVDPTTLPAERVALQRGNIATLRALAGEPYMHDPKLLRRLGAVTAPTLALWGESDRVATPAYGRAMAAAIPGSRFEIVRAAGHLPQIEQPVATFAAIDRFLASG